jgi:MFS superfamily sulfate permease-like transporter
LALLTGLVLIISGLLRLGVLADFMSKPVLGGFVIGLAISIAVGQLDKILGYEVEPLNFVPDILAIIRDLGMTHIPTLIVGVVSLALLFLMHKYTPKIPAAITVVFLAIILSGVFDFEAAGIHIVGEIPAGARRPYGRSNSGTFAGRGGRGPGGLCRVDGGGSLLCHQVWLRDKCQSRDDCPGSG